MNTETSLLNIRRTTTGLLCLLLLTGCAAQSEIAKFYNPSLPTLAHKPINPSHVDVVEFSNKEGLQAFLREKLCQQSYQLIGCASFSGDKDSLPELRKFAASVGGDWVVRKAEFLGIKQGSRMVVGSYTPASSTYTTGTAFGTASGTAYTSGSTPFGPYNQTTYGSGSSFGTATATTFNPAQVNYVRQNFEYPVFDQEVIVLQSTQAQKSNWPNMQKCLNLDKEGFVLDLAKVSSQEQIRNAPPAVQELAKHQKAGRMLNPIEAQQFIRFYSQAQFWRDHWQEVLKLAK